MKKSPKRSKTPNPRLQKQSKQASVSPEVTKIMTIKNNFRKNIQTPIDNIEAISHGNMPQRCLIHNTIYTLYCQFDRKPLCASCMFQQETHRKHRVIPIARAMNLVKQDILAFQIKIQENLSLCSNISRKLQQVLIKNQRFYPSVSAQLKAYYESMINMIKQKQKQQMQQVKQLQIKMRTQILYLDQQIKRISGVLKSKITPLKKGDDDCVLTRRNVLQILIQVNKIIHEEINEVFPEQENASIIDFNLFTDIFQIVRNRLIITLPGISIEPRNRTYSLSKKNQKISPRNLKVNYNEEKAKMKGSASKVIKNENKKIAKQVKFNIQ